jgi:hypothetical protein
MGLIRIGIPSYGVDLFVSLNLADHVRVGVKGISSDLDEGLGLRPLFSAGCGLLA